MKRALDRDQAKEVMTLHDLAAYLDCHYTTVFRMVRQGALPGSFRLGAGRGSWRVLRSEITKWIAAQQAHASKPGKKA